jgi:DNA-binding cell septation regulator SpoVG
MRFYARFAQRKKMRPRITKITFSGKPNGRFLTYVSVVFENNFVIRWIKLIRRSGDKILVAMPSKIGVDDKYYDIVHPINIKYRQEFEFEIIKAYIKQNDSKKYAEATTAKS